MNKPTNFRELLAYLKAHDGVLFRGTDGTEERQWCRGYFDGHLYFRNAEGSSSHVPIECGLTSAETGLAFLPDRFTVTKFGRTVEFIYVEE
jgi:hypothetical protein